MATLDLGRRICVYGPAGSGKTTVGRELARRFDLPFVELDAIYHARPNWEALSPQEFREAVSGSLAGLPDGWVIDGNYSAVRDLILPLADSVIWLRLPWVLVYPRLVWRTLSRMVTREPLWGVNRESFTLCFCSRDSILLWGIRHWRSGLAATDLALRTIPHNARVYVIRRPHQLRRFWRLVADSAGAAEVSNRRRHRPCDG